MAMTPGHSRWVTGGLVFLGVFGAGLNNSGFYRQVLGQIRTTALGSVSREVSWCIVRVFIMAFGTSLTRTAVVGRNRTRLLGVH